VEVLEHFILLVAIPEASSYAAEATETQEMEN
jgi:hypothetical protein